MTYYHDLITEQSWEELQRLQKNVSFVLIGGWATYLYTRTLKSKDIDIIIDYDQLPVLEQFYSLYKNERLKKYEAIKGEVQIDVYLPHYSALGIPVEDLIRQSASVEGFSVIEAHYLLALKIYTLTQRGRTPKGRKDFLDILSLLNVNITTLSKTYEILSRYHLSSCSAVFLEMLSENTETPELGLNKHQYSRLKKNILQQI